MEREDLHDGCAKKRTKASGILRQNKTYKGGMHIRGTTVGRDVDRICPISKEGEGGRGKGGVARDRGYRQPSALGCMRPLYSPQRGPERGSGLQSVGHLRGGRYPVIIADVRGTTHTCAPARRGNRLTHWRGCARSGVDHADDVALALVGDRRQETLHFSCLANSASRTARSLYGDSSC